MIERTAIILFFLFTSSPALYSCGQRPAPAAESSAAAQDSVSLEQPREERITADRIILEKEFLYDQYTLADTYPYKDTVRRFQWDKIRERLAVLENIQQKKASWGIFQNYKNTNREAPLVKNFRRDDYNMVTDTLGVQRYQSVPLYLPEDLTTPVRYGRDGSPVKIVSDTGAFVRVETFDVAGEWMVPTRYVKPIGDTVVFRKAVFVDRTNQNIATIEKSDSKWLVRSMNPTTTGAHHPPFQHETPLGFFLVQEKKPRMIYNRDGSSTTAGYSPYASRFTNGAYLHGVPVNLPRTEMIEFSPSLGTVPRSHMCVRNATSHAKYIYEWEEVLETMVFVFD